MHIRRAAATILLAGLAGSQIPARAQDITLGPKLSFEAASVKINQSKTRAPMQWQPGGTFTMGLPIQSVLTFALGVPLNLMVNVPDWVTTVFFDINARANRPVTVEERAAYYRGLLEERFGLVAHVEEREMPVYALTLARSDGRLGPGLRAVADPGCDAIIAEYRKRAEAGNPVIAKPGVRSICGSQGGPASITAGAVELSALTALFANGLQRPVIDRTGLKGRFDIDFKSAPLRQAGPNAPGADLPSVFTAVQEQLGLKLEPTTAPVPVVVIDRLEMPSEN